MRTFFAAAFLLFSVPAYAQDSGKVDRFTTEAYQTFNLADLDWFDAPSLKKGGQIALVMGDPGKDAAFMLYLRMPTGYTILPHSHPFSELITVVQGRLANGIGEKFDREKVDMIETGSSFALPANQAHYLWNDEETIVLLTATGPWGVNYVDPKDDPRNN